MPLLPAGSGLQRPRAPASTWLYKQALIDGGVLRRDVQFEDDVYIATSEPHGNIEAVITREDLQPHCKL